MHVLIFLIDAVVSFFCTLFLLRFLMQVTRVSFARQLGRFVVSLTDLLSEQPQEKLAA